MLTQEFQCFMKDIVFKEALYQNPKALKDFIEVLLDKPKNSININEIKYETYLANTNIKERKRRTDMLIYFDQTILNLEFYTSFNFRELLKSVIYVMKLFINQRIKKEKKKEVKNVIQINIVSKNTQLAKDAMIHQYEHINKYNTLDKILEKEYQMIVYDIDLLYKYRYTINERKRKWLSYIKAGSYEEMEKIGKGDEIFMELTEWVKNFCDEEQERDFFQKWSEENQYLSGKEEGIAEGKAQGKKENQQEIAIEMLKNNVSINNVIKYTKLPINIINRLKKQI